MVILKSGQLGNELTTSYNKQYRYEGMIRMTSPDPVPLKGIRTNAENTGRVGPFY